MPALRTLLTLSLLLAFLIPGPRAMAMTENERDYLRSLVDWIPGVSCQEGRMLRQCYVWTGEDCELSTEQATRSCLNLYQKDWMQPLSGSLDDWRTKIQDCVVRDIKSKNRHRIVESLMCANKGVTK